VVEKGVEFRISLIWSVDSAVLGFLWYVEEFIGYGISKLQSVLRNERKLFIIFIKQFLNN
jgi:hypothetical protein